MATTCCAVFPGCGEYTELVVYAILKEVVKSDIINFVTTVWVGLGLEKGSRF